LIGLDPNLYPILFTPFTILIATGLESTINKWYGLFPKNPYARGFGLLPISILTVLIIIGNVSFFFYGSHYIPAIATINNPDLTLVRQELSENTVLYVENDEKNLAFYKILEHEQGISVVDSLPDRLDSNLISFTKITSKDLKLDQIITSHHYQNSNRLYIYTKN
jgi:hypothetical protein